MADGPADAVPAESPPRTDSAAADPTSALRRGGWRKKAALALGSFLATALLLELCARLVFAVAPSTPWHVRDGVYHHSLPVVNGHRYAIPEEREGRLRRTPVDGEVRIAVFGESSVQGAPWGLDASPPAILYDLLAPRLEGRTLTVINMGRGSTTMLDAYYYLLATAPYRPEYVIFYQGTNDNLLGFEACLPVRHPWVHAVWRAAVSRSRLLWGLRVRGPDLLRGADRNRGPGPSGQPGGCDTNDGRRRWIATLLDTAVDTGAQVIVATPTRHDLAGVEIAQSMRPGAGPLADGLAAFDPEYLALLRCSLDEGCVLGDVVSEIVAADPDPAPDSIAYRLSWWPRDTDTLGAQWRSEAESRGIPVIEWHQLLRESAPDHVVATPPLADVVHLSIDGYATLASTWARTVEALHRGEPAPALTTDDLTTPDTARYHDHIDTAGTASRRSNGYCLLSRDEAGRWLSVSSLVIASSFLRTAWEGCADRESGLMLGWLRTQVGLPPQLPEDLADALETADIDALVASFEWGSDRW